MMEIEARREEERDTTPMERSGSTFDSRRGSPVNQVPTTMRTRGPIDTWSGPSHSCKSPSIM